MRAVSKVLVMLLVLAAAVPVATAATESTSKSTTWGSAIRQDSSHTWDSSTCSGATAIKPRTVTGKWTRLDTSFYVKNAKIQLNAVGQPCTGGWLSDGRTKTIGTPSYGTTYSQPGSSTWPYLSAQTSLSLGAFAKAEVHRGTGTSTLRTTLCHTYWHDFQTSGCP